MSEEYMSPVDKENQEIVNKIAIAWPIILIAGSIAFFTGALFYCSVSAYIAWILFNQVAEIFAEEFSAAKGKLFKWWDAVADKMQSSDFDKQKPAPTTPSAVQLAPDTLKTLCALKVDPSVVPKMYHQPGMSAATTSTGSESPRSPRLHSVTHRPMDTVSPSSVLGRRNSI